jgi:hypothetical protein
MSTGPWPSSLPIRHDEIVIPQAAPTPIVASPALNLASLSQRLDPAPEP